MKLRFAAPLLAIWLGACGHSGHGSPAAASATPRNSRLFTAEDIEMAKTRNLYNVYDMVRAYRPEWLRPTITPSQGSILPSAWVDTQRLGGPNSLRSVPLNAVTRIRFLTASEAQGELGLDNLGGAIVVSTRN